LLAALNNVLAEHDVNVGGQVLATRGQLGYVVTDTDSPLTGDVLGALASIEDTVRLRVID
jgi:D-3-phosphoglycerate dehydrogenase